MPTDPRKPVVIIGAGIGGLSAAIRLAAAGRRVVMLEQNPAAGGKMSQIVQDGFRWDTGPSVITMRHVFEDLFAAAGRQLGVIDEAMFSMVVFMVIVTTLLTPPVLTALLRRRAA